MTRAVQYNDPLRIHQELVKLYEGSNKQEQAIATHEMIVKRWHEQVKVWLTYANYLFHEKKLDEARALLPRALAKLAKSDRE